MVARTLTLIGGSLLLCYSAGAINANNTYDLIKRRNVFGLKDPAPPPANTNVSNPLPKILLQGYTTATGIKLALFKLVPVKPDAATKEQSLILAEGQREAGVEVLHIDEKSGSIKFDNHGTVMTLNLERDGLKPTAVATGAPPAVAGNIPVPPALPNPAGQSPALPGAPQPAPLTPGLKRIPSRVPRAPGGDAANSLTAPSPLPVPQSSQAPNQERPLSPEEQTVLMELERERANSNPQSTAPPLPPTALSPQ
jgi:hypothetical protein